MAMLLCFVAIAVHVIGTIDTCAPGYYEQVGDTPGWGEVDGAGRGQKVANCNECGDLCNARSACNAYECSTTELKCNLNKNLDPTVSSYKDYMFCSKSPVPGWFKGAMGSTCDETCGNYEMQCNADKQSEITSAHAVKVAFAEAGYSCKTAHEGHSRDYAGSPFATERDNDDCYYLTPGGQQSVCDANAVGHHAPLCFCGEVEECVSQTVYDSGPHKELVPVRGSNPLFYLDMTDNMEFSMDIIINSFPSSWGSIFHCGTSNGVRMPGIWIHPTSDDVNGIGWHIAYSTKANGNDNAQRKGPQLFANTKYNLVIQVTQSSIQIFLNGDILHSDMAYSEHALNYHEPCYVGDPWYAGADVVIKNLKVVSDCVDRKCNNIEGGPGIIWGDPHTTTFAGVKHDFQGKPYNGLDQFYYIAACHGKNRDELPYQVLGRHVPYGGSTRVAGLDYLAIELFDENDHRYVAFFSHAIHGYVMGEETDYDAVKNSPSYTSLSAGTSTIGNRFSVAYTQTDSRNIHVILTVDGECDLEFTMFGSHDWNSGLNRYTMHYVRVNPPTCYKCASCGLFGDFMDFTMQTCDGRIMDGFGGWDNAWDERGWTWEKTFYKEHCPVPPPDATTTTEGPNATPSPIYIPPTDPPYEDPCMDHDSHHYKESERHCEEGRNRDDVNKCCENIGGTFCDDLMTNCPFDACILSNGDVDLIDDQVDDILIQPVLKECDDLVIDSSDYVRETSQPTHKPTAKPTQVGIVTDAPTPEPTRSPVTNRPTHKPTNRPTTATPTRRPTTANPTMKPTHRPTTAEPTNKPTQRPTTAEPTRKPTHRPTTSEPTQKPTDEPTTAEPTRRPTHRPTTSEPTLKPTHRPTTADPTKRPTDATPHPTHRITLDPTTAKPTRRPTSGTYLTPEPSRTYLTPEPTTANPTERPTEDQSGWGTPMPTKKAPKTKAPKPTKAPKTKKPKPTKAPKTKAPKPTKAPKTKAPKTSKPTKAPKKTKKPTRDKSTYLTPEPTVASGWGAPNPSMRGDKNKREEILAVDVNGVTETSLTGYSMQTEIAGMISIGLVLLIVAYSMLCKANKNEQYIAIEEQQVV